MFPEHLVPAYAVKVRRAASRSYRRLRQRKKPFPAYNDAQALVLGAALAAVVVAFLMVTLFVH